MELYNKNKKHNMFMSMSNAWKADIRASVTHVKMQKLSLKGYTHIKNYKIEEKFSFRCIPVGKLL